LHQTYTVSISQSTYYRAPKSWPESRPTWSVTRAKGGGGANIPPHWVRPPPAHHNSQPAFRPHFSTSQANISASPTTTLDEGCRENQIYKLGCSDVQMFCTGQRHYITPNEFLRSSDFEVVFAQRHHHHWSSVVHGCRLSTTELFRSLLPPPPLPLSVSGTNYRITSRLHRPLYEFSGSRLKTSFQPFQSRISAVWVS